MNKRKKPLWKILATHFIVASLSLTLTYKTTIFFASKKIARLESELANEKEERAMEKGYKNFYQEMMTAYYSDTSEDGLVDKKEINDLLIQLGCEQMPADYHYEGKLLIKIFPSDYAQECSYKIDEKIKQADKAPKAHKTLDQDGIPLEIKLEKEATVVITAPRKEVEYYIRIHMAR